MKLATFSPEADATPRLGVVVDDGIVDLSQCGSFPADMTAMLEQGIDPLAISAAIEGLDPMPLAAVALHAPVVAGADHFAVAYQHTADRHAAPVKPEPGLFQGEGHIVAVVHAKPLCAKRAV